MKLRINIMKYSLLILGVTCIAFTDARVPPPGCPVPARLEPTYYLGIDEGWSKVEAQCQEDLDQGKNKQLKAYLNEKNDLLKSSLAEGDDYDDGEISPGPPPPVCESGTEIINHWKVMNTQEDEECWLAEALPWVTCIPSADGSTEPAFLAEKRSSGIGFQCRQDYVWRNVNVYCVGNDNGAKNKRKKIKRKARFTTMLVRVAYCCKAMMFKCEQIQKDEIIK